MTKTFKGLDCIADEDTDLYAEYAAASQLEITWMGQSVYALYVIYFGVVVLFLLIIKKMFYMYTDYSARNTSSKRFNIPIINKLSAASRYLAYKRIPLVLSRITGLPSSFGTLFIFFASTLYVLCYAFIPHYWYRGCSGFGTPPIAIRTGMIVMGMTPFIYIMSGKTNFISGVTGISYEKLNVFHQALGWGSLFFSLVHTVVFLVQDTLEGGLTKVHNHWKSELLYRNGVPPLIFLFFLCFAGHRVVRKYFYEAFWHSHWIIALAYFGTLAWHIYGAMGIEYLWGTVAFLGAQTIYRIIIKSPFRPNSFVFKHKEADVKILPNDLFQITIPISSHYEFFWKPGQHIFIRFMNGIHTLDNHPFSVLTIPKPTGKSSMKLIVRPQGGLTKKIYENVLNEKNLEKKYRVLIDGGYGGMNRDSLSFDKLILIASGTGVSVTFPFMLYSAMNLRNSSNNVKSIEFTWIIRNLESLEWIKEQLLELLNIINSVDSKLLAQFTFNIFVTNSQDSSPQLITNQSELQISENPSDNLTESKESLQISESIINESNYLKYLNIYVNQKPLLSKYVSSLNLLQKNAVIVSGTASLQVDVGNAVSELQKSVIYGGDVSEVYLHTENFGW